MRELAVSPNPEPEERSDQGEGRACGERRGPPERPDRQRNEERRHAPDDVPGSVHHTAG